MSDADLLARIAAALHEGRVEIAFAPGLESHMDFPGNSETDKGQFILVALVLLALAWHFAGWQLVAGVLVVILAAYFAFWRKVVRARMRRRFIANAMSNLKLWRKSWGFAGIALSAVGRDCRSPKGDWRAFAAELAAEVPSRSEELPRVEQN
jgi:hypothetical protein